jgi:predicted nuclease of predicted toxin-antitoxin system
MNFVADEGVEAPIVRRLRTDGHEVIYLAEDTRGIADEQILSKTNQGRALLITTDKDFGELVFRQQRVHAGVVLIRLAGLSNYLKSQIENHNR